MWDEVLRLAAALGKVEESEELSLLCGAAVEELTGMLRPGVTPEECGEGFCLAAAWMALAGLAAGGEDVESFTAGAVTIRQGDGAARRRALRMQAKQVMKPWLKDECFLFRVVRS